MYIINKQTIKSNILKFITICEIIRKQIQESRSGRAFGLRHGILVSHVSITVKENY